MTFPRFMCYLTVMSAYVFFAWILLVLANNFQY